MGVKKMCELAVVAVVVIAAMMAGGGEAQETQDCANQLMPCLNYINTTTEPPANCCTPLKQTVENERDCLCNLYKNPSIFEALHINITQATELPKRCGLSNDLSACNITGSPSPTGSPPATPGGNDDNSASMVAWTGISSLLLLCASLML